MMIKHFPAELLQEMCWPSSRVEIYLAQLTMNFDRRCIEKLGPHFTVYGCWNKSLHLQPLQLCYCENSESSVNACVMRRHYSITYMQSLYAINGLIPVGRVGKLTLWTPLVFNFNFDNIDFRACIREFDADKNRRNVCIFEVLGRVNISGHWRL